MAVGFFDAENSTPDQLIRRRQELDYLASRNGRQQTYGAGVGDLLTGIVGGLQRYKTNKSEQRGVDAANKAWSAFQPFAQQAPQAPQMSGGEPSPNPAITTPQGRSQASAPPTDIATGIMATAKALGVNPIDLGTAISYETAGTFDPAKAGPRTQWGQHKGLIQFGEPQAKKYGVNWDDPIGSQLGENGAIAKYLRDTGVKPGMGLMDIYSAINAGGVGRNNRSDANNGGAPGTVADKVNSQMAAHRAKAMKLFPQGNTQVASNDPQFMPTSAPPQDVPQETMQPQQPMQQQPQQVAQADNSRMNELMQLMANPWLDDSKKAIVQQMYQQELQKQDPAYQMKMEGDQLDMKYKQAQIDNMGEGDVVSVGGRLVNRKTGQVVYDPPQDTTDKNERGLQVVYGKDEKGNLVAMQTRKGGGLELAPLPEGVASLAPGVDYLNTGTGFVPVDSRGGNIPQGGNVAPIPIDVAGEAAASALGKEKGAAQATLPAAKITAEQTISKIDELLATPNFGAGFGVESYMPKPVAGVKDWVFGTPDGQTTVDLRARVDQLRGSAFLEAYNGLRGGGQITEVEGKKAEDALARLDAAQTDGAARQALKDFRDAVQQGYAKLGAKSGVPAPALNVPSPQKPIEQMSDEELEALANGQ